MALEDGTEKQAQLLTLAVDYCSDTLRHSRLL
nr:hypothetical protein [Enterobacter cloacae complex sp. P39RS]